MYNGYHFNYQNSGHCPDLYLKHDVSETGFRLTIHVEPTPETETISIYLAQLSRIHLKAEKSCGLNKIHDNG
jgi:hypothetical protein